MNVFSGRASITSIEHLHATDGDQVSSDCDYWGEEGERKTNVYWSGLEVDTGGNLFLL